MLVFHRLFNVLYQDRVPGSQVTRRAADHASNDEPSRLVGVGSAQLQDPEGIDLKHVAACEYRADLGVVLRTTW